MFTDPRKAYREHLIHTGSMPDIFVGAYDRIVNLLDSAADSTEKHEIEAKTRALNQALTIIVTLEGALDFERGGEVAANLARFYKLLRADIFKGSAKLDAGILRQAAAHVAEIRRIWEQAQTLNAGPAASGPSSPPCEANPAAAPAEDSLTPHDSSAGWSA